MEAKALYITTFQYGCLPDINSLPLLDLLPFIFEQNTVLDNVNIRFISTQLLSSSGHFINPLDQLFD